MGFLFFLFNLLAELGIDNEHKLVSLHFDAPISCPSVLLKHLVEILASF